MYNSENMLTWIQLTSFAGKLQLFLKAAFSKRSSADQCDSVIFIQAAQHRQCGASAADGLAYRALTLCTELDSVCTQEEVSDIEQRV